MSRLCTEDLLSAEEPIAGQKACHDEQPFLESWIRHRPRRRPGSARSIELGRATNEGDITVAGQHRVLTGFATQAVDRTLAPTLRRMRGLVRIAVAVVLLAACATSGYNASSLQRQLVRSGLTTKQADCVTNAMEDNFDIRRLGAHTKVTPNEIAVQRQLLLKCGVKVRPKP